MNSLKRPGLDVGLGNPLPTASAHRLLHIQQLVEMPSMLRACGLRTPQNLSTIFGWAHDTDPAAKLVCVRGRFRGGRLWIAGRHLCWRVGAS